MRFTSTVVAVIALLVLGLGYALAAPPDALATHGKNCGIVAKGGNDYRVLGKRMRCGRARKGARRYLRGNGALRGFSCTDDADPYEFICGSGSKTYRAERLARARAHPGHMFEEVALQADARAYSPSPIAINVNQGVLWRWQEGVIFPDHSVTSDVGQAESFDSGSRASGTFLHVFREPGTYAYHCTVHAAMAGTVEVRPPPGEAPRLKRLRVSSGPTPVARVRASKRGDLVGRIASRRDGRWRTEKAFSRRAQRGANEVALPTRPLDDGRYRLTLAIYDLYGRRDSAKARFALR